MEAPLPAAFDPESRPLRDDLRRLSSDVFDLFPFGIMVADADGRAVAMNGELSRLVGVPADEPASCCELFGCRRPGGPLAGACLTHLAIATGKRLPELCVELPTGEAGAAWPSWRCAPGTSKPPPATWTVSASSSPSTRRSSASS